MHVEELPQDLPQHPHQLQQHPHPQPDVDLLNGPLTNGVMMKTTMKLVILMEELVASMTSVDGTPIVKYSAAFSFLFIIFI